MDNTIDFKTLRQHITVTLSDLPNYSTKAVVLNTEVNIDVGYNPRSMKRWVKIYDANKMSYSLKPSYPTTDDVS